MHPAEGKGFFRGLHLLNAGCYVLTHKFSFHCEKDCLRSPDCEKTGQLAARKRYASERACFRPSTAQIPVKIYRSNAKSYSTNDNTPIHNALSTAFLKNGHKAYPFSYNWLREQPCIAESGMQTSLR